MLANRVRGPERRGGITPAPLAERFWSHVDRGAPDECWRYSNQRNKNGYALIELVGIGSRGAHRVSFFLTHGYWPIVARHTCDNRSCVNPAHILDGSQADNMRDMDEKGRRRNRFSGQTHCKHGHEFTAENTYIDRNGYRNCRACKTRVRRNSYSMRRT